MSPRPAVFTAALFDMDGLLLDSERPIQQAWLPVAKQLGVASAHAKPAPDICLLAAARLGADASRTLALEDSGHGALAAIDQAGDERKP